MVKLPDKHDQHGERNHQDQKNVEYPICFELWRPKAGEIGPSENAGAEREKKGAPRQKRFQSETSVEFGSRKSIVGTAQKYGVGQDDRGGFQ